MPFQIIDQNYRRTVHTCDTVLCRNDLWAPAMLTATGTYYTLCFLIHTCFSLSVLWVFRYNTATFTLCSLPSLFIVYAFYYSSLSPLEACDPCLQCCCNTCTSLSSQSILSPTFISSFSFPLSCSYSSACKFDKKNGYNRPLIFH